MKNCTDFFELAFSFVCKHEGAGIDPIEGEVFYGISRKKCAAIGLNWDDLDLQTVKNYYKSYYWKKEYEMIVHKQIAIKIFDLAVNVGHLYAHKIAQRALRSANCRLEENGIMNRQTVNAINAANFDILIAAMRSETAGYYRSIVAHLPSKKIYLAGWLNRAYS